MRFVYNALALAFYTALGSLAALFALPFTRSTKTMTAIARWWAKRVVSACGVKVSVEGLEQQLDAPAYLVMANHTSHFDVLAVYSTVPIDMRPVAKRELGYIPIFGWALMLGAAIMIDRGDRKKAVASIQRAGKQIRDGRSVLMFPEGTRTPPGVLGEMKKGPFHLAIEAGVPVLPLGIRGTGEVLLPGDWRIHPGPVHLRVGRPIETLGLPEGDEGRDRLSAQVSAALSDLIR